MKNILELKNIGKKYQAKNGEIEALKNVNLKVQEGEFVSIIGPSGCGKSTLLSIIAGLEKQTSGEVLKKGEIGYMLQTDSLLPWRTIYKNVLFGLEIRKTKTLENEKYAQELLKKYNLYEFKEKYPNQLSGGEQQRVALARAMATKPPIIIADEPTGNLDPATAGDIFKTLNEINARGTTVLVVTHAKDIVDRMGKRVIALDHGRIVKDDMKGGY